MLLLTSCVIILCLCSITSSFQCKNEDNNDVDWYVLYKLPQLRTETNPLIKSGVAYLLITSETVGDDWKLSELSINDSRSIPGLTLKPLYETNKPSHILYNDQPPDQKESPRGHTKGAVLLNATHGFWLIHSVPHFPKPSSQQYVYPESGTVYGQSFLCLSMNLMNINTVGKQLLYNEPHIFSKFIDNTLANIVPDINKLANDVDVLDAPWYHVLNISTINNQVFTSFAKTKNFDLDLYVDLVAPVLRSNLYTETWQNGAGKMVSNCSKDYEVDNIRGVFVEKYGISFHSTHDHSKWAVSYKKQLNEVVSWICIGDINRADHQKLRGGGTVCIYSEKLWSDYFNIATTIEPCSKNTEDNEV